MSLPRRVLRHQVHMISRRVAGRRFLLKPSKSVTELVKYCLGVAAERHGILIHALILESNHYHFVLTDPEQKLPEFEHDFDQLVARGLNAHYGLGESFWAPGSYSNTEIHDEVTLLDKLLYTILRLTDKQSRCWADDGYPPDPGVRGPEDCVGVLPIRPARAPPEPPRADRRSWGPLRLDRLTSSHSLGSQ